jgi:hypothetical protein
MIQIHKTHSKYIQNIQRSFQWRSLEVCCHDVQIIDRRDKQWFDKQWFDQQWFDHASRIQENRLPEYLLDWKPKHGKRSRVRPRKHL